MKLLIPVAPRTKKNSQRIVVVHGRPMIIPSKQYKDYERDCAYFIPAEYRKKIDFPVNVKAHYFMPTRRRVDLVNLHEALHDILVKYDVLQDDNSLIIVGTDGSRVSYDKTNPRTEVEITEVNDGR